MQKQRAGESLPDQHVAETRKPSKVVAQEGFPRPAAAKGLCCRSRKDPLFGGHEN